MVTIEQIMSPRVVTIEMDDRISTAKEIFDNVPFHHLVVLDENKTISGILARTDLLNALSPNLGTAAELTRDIETLNKRVHQVMAHGPITITPSLDIQSASQLMLSKGITCFPVLQDDELVGIVSWRDLLGHYCGLVKVDNNKAEN
ncbi:CBS domain-containing protein [Shewanella sp. 1_MG-2023]|uniref:CBS domain-containing protein n=1 Tax=unclassified Shewanella TaxID=196818 RepID=UPI001E647289|nr:MULTISPECIES: CBS domain-containing protein [unclassified Shewanella]MCC4832921.1 CBS domain-containing protein [Shewanella sp. 10N.7]MDO6610943.1 CBS domain-containing protein [Shewanella sp. 7_MG-2023]MDO6770206.1 CBS domain-containing protein [Shewanella sp. 2_MG-2023]MDO6793347.1 CBS domain-containing protein [Shewanella sp. 1_MG-2023]